MESLGSKDSAGKNGIGKIVAKTHQLARRSVCIVYIPEGWAPNRSHWEESSNNTAAVPVKSQQRTDQSDTCFDPTSESLSFIMRDDQEAREMLRSDVLGVRHGAGRLMGQ